MPAQDGTGPQGMGPLTGRGFGPCGCGLGRGFGLGRFWRRSRLPKTNLTDYVKSLEEELAEAKKQLTKDQK